LLLNLLRVTVLAQRKSQVMFSKFDLGKLEKQAQKKTKGPMTAKQLLQKAEAAKERLLRVEQADPEKVSQ